MDNQDQAKQLRERKRMELFNTVYAQYSPLISQYTGDIARTRAEGALAAFDMAFPKPQASK